MKYFSAFLLIASLANLTFAKLECEVPCTREYRPVCGSDGQHYKVFANKCVLGNEHCKDGHMWFQTRMDACTLHTELEESDRCEIPCTREYMPVCGTDGFLNKLFPNQCVMKNQHCKDGHTWFQTRMDKCEAQLRLVEKQNCDVPCTREYNPVCGTDGIQYKVFPNRCVLSNAHCRDGHIWFQTFMDDCNHIEQKAEEGCEVRCTREYRPVCGTDGVQSKVFPNKCVMENEHCKDGHKWFQTRIDNCKKHSELEENEGCDVACTREYDPVCGTDGTQYKVFPNKCVLQNAHCQDGHTWFQTFMDDCGKVDLADEEKCEVPCTREYKPVCGTDGTQYKVFPNRCVMENEHCKDGHIWFQIFMDDCDKLEQSKKL